MLSYSIVYYIILYYIICYCNLLYGQKRRSHSWLAKKQTINKHNRQQTDTTTNILNRKQAKRSSLMVCRGLHARLGRKRRSAGDRRWGASAAKTATTARKQKKQHIFLGLLQKSNKQINSDKENSNTSNYIRECNRHVSYMYVTFPEVIVHDRKSSSAIERSQTRTTSKGGTSTFARGHAYLPPRHHRWRRRPEAGSIRRLAT